MSSLLKPKALKPGSMLGIVTPASAVKPELLAAGIVSLKALGYRTKLFPHALDRGPLYYAGAAPGRLSDLHAAFADPEVDGIICARGGWGSAELLERLDRKLIAANPKAFLGYSDLTSVHVWLRNEVGLVSFQAPMVAADFSKAAGVNMQSWGDALTRTAPWTLGEGSGLRLLRAARDGPPVAEGELGGGCLSIWAEALGTPYGPQARGGVLFFEDIGVKPYQWDRLLLHCRYAGMFAGVSGIVFGDMGQSCAADEQELLESALLHALEGFDGPILIGLRSGHVDAGNITVPFGVRVRLEVEDAAHPRMHFLEGSVTS